MDLNFIKVKKNLKNDKKYNYYFRFYYISVYIWSFDFIANQEYENGTVRSDTIQYFFAQDKTAILIKAGGNQPDLRLIFSEKDSIITGLYEYKNNKAGYILPMNEKYWSGMRYALRDYGTGHSTTLDTTGTKKVIKEVDFYEMRCDNEIFTGTFWITQEIEISLVQILGYQTVGAGENTSEVEMLDACGLKGLSIETILIDKKRNSKIKLFTKNFKKEFTDSIFNTKGYILSDMRKTE